MTYHVCDCGSPFQVHMSDDPKCSKLLGTYLPISQSTIGNNPAPQNAGLILAPSLPGSTSIGGDIQLLIAAQNRTTHAVRSIGITFVAAPVISVIVLLADLLAFMSKNIGVIVVVSLIGVIILLVVLVRALTELGQSQVP